MKKKIGFAITGSFCTLSQAVNALKTLTEDYDVLPILSEKVAATDTRFYRAADLRKTVEEICGKPPVTRIEGAEPIGPKKLLDALVVCPCTGNTLSKIAAGITDTAVTMSAKSCRRNDVPVVLALATNDALSGSAPAIGTLLSRKGFYFVPFFQDDVIEKPTSLQSDFSLTKSALEAAFSGKQIQPLFRTGK